MKNVLAKIFSSDLRIKLMKLFLNNPESCFSFEELKKKFGKNKNLEKEIKLLVEVSFIKKKFIKGKRSKKNLFGYQFNLNPNFSYLKAFKYLFDSDSILKKSYLVRFFRPVGKIKFLVISGTLLHDFNSPIDILFVGDNLNKKLLEEKINLLEKEIGKELNYALFNTSEFKNRIVIYDKFLRDVFNSPHEKIIDYLGINPQDFSFPLAVF